MAGPSTMLSASATPTQKTFVSQASGVMPPINTRSSFERDGLQPPTSATNGGRNLSASAVTFAPRGSSLNPSMAPGSFSSELRSQYLPQRTGSRADAYNLEKLDEDDDALAEQALSALRESLNREMKIKEGSENMLEALNSKKAKQTKEQRQRVEAELNASNLRIKELRQRISEGQRPRATPTTPTRTRTEGLLQTNGLRSPPSASRSGAGSDFDEPTESPTFALAEILQALEVEGMSPEYYVGRANSLVELFKRHPTLKYDLVWSVFGLRMQVMLLSESREVVAAGYRMIRYAISDVSSLKKIRALNTDYLVVLSLIKERKADVEREQALKFVRAFLDVKDGVREVSRAVVRTIVAVAEHDEDRLRPICLETLAEILVRDPRLLIVAGGLDPLSEALAEGSYKAPESLVAAFLYLLDAPQRRKYLRPGYELEVLFTAFTDDLMSNESILKQNSKAIASSLKTWPGLMTLAMFDFRAIRSLISSLMLPNGGIRETVIDLIYSLLRIKSPAWATSFLAGRRLTTYGRVASLKSATNKNSQTYVEDDGGEQNFVDHYTALLLAIFIKSGLLPALLQVAQDTDNPALKRKSTLLTGEVLRLASRLLPPSWSDELQLLPGLFSAAARMNDEAHFVATGVVYQISTVSRTLYRSLPTAPHSGALPSSSGLDIGILDEHPKASAAMTFDDATFRQLLIDSAVLSSSNFGKWNWDVVLKIIEGPLLNGKRLEEAIKASKFIKRIMSFYRPFKYRFSETKSTRNTQKYVRTGCALMHTLLQTPEGVRYLADNKLLRQVAECLAQCDPTSGLTAQFPMFSKDRLVDTLCGGYFPMLGVLSSDSKGLQMLDRWRMFNMMYHIIDLKQRPDLIKLLLTHFDYSLQGHPRVLLSKSLTAANKDLRIHATNVLRKYATSPRPDSKWAIQLLVTQLYDPEVEVCATAVKTLEKACNIKNNLEYIVECRPALDHLGEIGAPLLLRFLSTSIGYHYLDGLDYISNEMDDWFLGRNDSYVSLIEASLARAFVDHHDEPSNRMSMFDDEQDGEADSHIPPHFYRELTRTQEGCKLLSDKGHFNDFAATIREHGMQSDDPEVIVKVKGCMWAVGNVGSMELGAPFLESSDVVGRIVDIAQRHDIMSLRGTAFFVLGLVSRSVHGLEILSEHGWDANTNSLGASLGFCIPMDLSNFFSCRPWRHENVSHIQLPSTQKTQTTDPPKLPSRPRSESLLRALEADQEDVGGDETRGADGGGEAGPGPLAPRVELDSNPTSQRVLELVVDLGNAVLYKRAMAELARIKQQQRKHRIGTAPGAAAAKIPTGFRQPGLFKKVMSLMECRHYRLQVRRVVMELFDKSVLRQVVFGEDTSGDDEDEDEEIMAPMERGGGAEVREGDGGAATSDGAGGGPCGESHFDDDDDEEEEEDLEADEEDEYDSSGDEQRTERQRSISDPSDLENGTVANRGT